MLKGRINVILIFISIFSSWVEPLFLLLNLMCHYSFKKWVLLTFYNIKWNVSVIFYYYSIESYFHFILDITYPFKFVIKKQTETSVLLLTEFNFLQYIIKPKI